MRAQKSAAYSISQNFLTGGALIERLLDTTTIGPDDAVWEIGPGKGHITRRLLARCGHLTAVEIDPALHAWLADALGGAGNLRLIHGDFLHARLPARGAYKVFANLLFCCTTAMIDHLTYASNPPRDCWLVIERGAALRFAGRPQERARSLCLKACFDVRIVRRIGREAFHPMPSVDAALLHLHRRLRAAVKNPHDF